MLRGVEFGESIPHRPERGCEGIAFLLEFAAAVATRVCKPSSVSVSWVIPSMCRKGEDCEKSVTGAKTRAVKLVRCAV